MALPLGISTMITTLGHGPFSDSSQAKDFTSTALDLSLGSVTTTQKYLYGTRYITWDGRVFKYSHSVGTLYAGYGAANILFGTTSQLINSVTPAAYAANDTKILVTVASTEGYAGDGVVAENELAGGYIVFGHGSATTTESHMIMHNTAVASGGGATWVTLDYPVIVAHAAGVACECPGNPYRYLSKGNYEYNAFMCVPITAASSGYDFWGQTWGPCWCVPGGSDSSPGDTANDRTAYFVGDGSVNFGYSLTVESGYQKAGFCMDCTESGTSAMPLVCLQISI